MAHSRRKYVHPYYFLIRKSAGMPTICLTIFLALSRPSRTMRCAVRTETPFFAAHSFNEMSDPFFFVIVGRNTTTRHAGLSI